MVMDLTTTYLGLPLKNPFVVAASPLSRSLDSMKRLEDAGAAAIVLYSIFEEQLVPDKAGLSPFLAEGAESSAEARSYFPSFDAYATGPEEYLEHIRRARESVEVPIIGSLNGTSTGGWISYAQQIEEAGAHAIELNIYLLGTDPDTEGVEIERVYVDTVEAVKASVTVPVAVKIGPFFSSPANMAKRLAHAGADALVLFNRFYQPDLDLDRHEVRPGLVLSSSSDLRLPLRWIAILYGRIAAELAGTTGVHTAEDAVKLILAGAQVAQLCAVLLANGHEHLRRLLADLGRWMERHEYGSIRQMRGNLSQRAVAEPGAFERANYMKALTAFDNLV
jgi:dihydroorotate dehydrogenase (fumarate)